MSPQYQAIYLSPHLDDAAFSCGGQIHARTQQGERVLIVTLMAGDPPPSSGQSAYINALHERWQLAADAVAQRRAEDAAACRILGAEYLHLPFADCIYRMDGEKRPFYQSDQDIFGTIHPQEQTELVARVEKAIASLPPSEQIFAPLTVGNHVDHQLTRIAAEIIFDGRLRYYDEYPYARKKGAVEAVIKQESGWNAAVIPLTKADTAAKIAAICAFRSQLSSFFENEADVAKKMEAYHRITGGEIVRSRSLVSVHK